MCAQRERKETRQATMKAGVGMRLAWCGKTGKRALVEGDTYKP